MAKRIIAAILFSLLVSVCPIPAADLPEELDAETTASPVDEELLDESAPEMLEDETSATTLEEESTFSRLSTHVKEDAEKVGGALKRGSVRAAEAAKTGARKTGETAKKGYQAVKNYLSDE
ncbi:MAG: hypothetical protein LBU79_04355 [Planctomycetota bacterium]|nr:hypothetical protein [Planctomycetota bacterium]